MESIVGIFNSLADAKRGEAMLRALGISGNRITVLAPRTSEAEVQAQIARYLADALAEFLSRPRSKWWPPVTW